MQAIIAACAVHGTIQDSGPGMNVLQLSQEQLGAGDDAAQKMHMSGVAPHPPNA